MTRLALLFAFASCIVGPLLLSSQLCAEEKAPELKAPSYVTKYDIATREELFYRRMLGPLIKGEGPSDWPILTDLTDQLGDWVQDYINAEKVSIAITQGMATEGQPPLREIDQLVKECAKILHMKEKPLVYVHNSPFTKAYATSAGGRNILVLTSGLLRLFEGQPNELRFIIGRELGHIKCDHLKMKAVGYGLLQAISVIDLKAVPDRFQLILPTLALGRLLTWAREAEISADRAGLLCCQDPQTAYQALSRLLSGLDAKSSWVDPNAEGFDARKIVADFHKWENDPFVKFVIHIKKSSAEEPFIPERIAALQLWAETEQYKDILARKRKADLKHLVVIKQIGVAGLAPKSDPVNPYIIGYDGEKRFFSTSVVSDATSAHWRFKEVARTCMNGQPLFFEIWDSRTLADGLLGGFVIYPEKGKRFYVANINWNWNERSEVVRDGIVEVEVGFEKLEK